MREIKGKKYLTEKEAAVRYGYSPAWFQRARHNDDSPPYVKLQGKGKVLYPLEEVDTWFDENMKLTK